MAACYFLFCSEFMFFWSTEKQLGRRQGQTPVGLGTSRLEHGANRACGRERGPPLLAARTERGDEDQCEWADDGGNEERRVGTGTRQVGSVGGEVKRQVGRACSS